MSRRSLVSQYQYNPTSAKRYTLKSLYFKERQRLYDVIKPSPMAEVKPADPLVVIAQNDIASYVKERAAQAMARVLHNRVETLALGVQPYNRHYEFKVTDYAKMLKYAKQNRGSLVEQAKLSTHVDGAQWNYEGDFVKGAEEVLNDFIASMEAIVTASRQPIVPLHQCVGYVDPDTKALRTVTGTIMVVEGTDKPLAVDLHASTSGWGAKVTTAVPAVRYTNVWNEGKNRWVTAAGAEVPGLSIKLLQQTVYYPTEHQEWITCGHELK